MVHGDLLPVLELLLDRQSDLGFDAVDTCLVPTLVGQDYTTLLLDVANGAESVGDRDQLRATGLALLHALVKL
jgi:hypothetical protein